MDVDDFDVDDFEKRLTNLKDTQESIQILSKWCLEQRRYHKKVVSSWLNVLKQDRVEHRLTLFYLANDVIQYSKRKHYEFVDSWGTALQRATTMVRDDRVREKISRIFNIWKQREIYSEESITDLLGLLNMNPIKKKIQPEDGDDYQNTKLIGNINDCERLGSETDKAFKNLLIRSPNFNLDTIKNSLKDKRHSEDIGKDIDNIVTDLEGFLTKLKNEVKSRKLLIKHIDQADTFYGNQKGEVKVVFNAYKNFGTRMKLMKKKLDELTVNLPSPIPSPDINAPSPEPDADITLPGETPASNSLNMNLLNVPANGYTSYMEGNLPFDINDFKSESSYGNGYDHTQNIQVINTRSDDQNAESSQNRSSSDKPYNLSSSVNYSNTSLNYGSQNNSYSLDTSYNPLITTRNNNAPNILQPPPMAPSLDICNDFDTWNMPSTLWSNSSFSTIDTPVSPPQYEAESNQSLIEYSEENDNFITLKDVDHRKLSFSQPEPIKENGRLADVDHRNLIPLTGGSPRNALQKKNFDDPFQTQFKSSNVDVDHRTGSFNNNNNENTILLKPPPLPPILGPPPGLSPLLGAPMHLPGPGLHSNDIDIREKPPAGNIESIDMEMSDEDFDSEYAKDDSINNYNRSLSTDSSPSLLSPSWNNPSTLDQQQQSQLHQQQFLNPWKQSQRIPFHGQPRIPFSHDNNSRRPPLLSESPTGHFQRPPYQNRRGNINNRRGNFQPRGRPFFRGPRPWM